MAKMTIESFGGGSEVRVWHAPADKPNERAAVDEPFASTQKAEQWIKRNGQPGVVYEIVAVRKRITKG